MLFLPTTQYRLAVERFLRGLAGNQLSKQVASFGHHPSVQLSCRAVDQGKQIAVGRHQPTIVEDSLVDVDSLVEENIYELLFWQSNAISF